MLVLKQKGNFDSTIDFLEQKQQLNPRKIMELYGQIGVEELEKATPKRTGLTASSWYYKIDKIREGYRLSLCNSNIQNGTLIALVLQYGHGTQYGGWVEGRDYIEPAIKPIFDKLSQKLGLEVKKQ